MREIRKIFPFLGYLRPELSLKRRVKERKRFTFLKTNHYSEIGRKHVRTRSISSWFQLPLPTCWERTALHQAVKYNHADVVHLLVQAGADVNAKDEHLVTPLLLAGSGMDRDDAQEMAKFVKIIKILSNKAFVNIIHPDTGISQPIVTQ